MQFVNPLFLFGLLAISIPVIIHLFNFRKYRKVYFTNVKFLQEIKQETQKRSQLRHLIILALRILAIAALAFAFAQPYIPVSKNNKPVASGNIVSVFVDNSFSMEAMGSNGSLFEEARRKAREIAGAYKPSDRFQLLTNDFEGKHQRLISKEEFLLMLDEVKVSASVRTMSEVISRQDDILKTSEPGTKTAYVISDFQKSVFGNYTGGEDDGIQRYLLPLKANMQGNVYIDTCWFDLPLQQTGQASALNVRILNKSGSSLEKIPVKLTINGTQKAIATAGLEADGSSVISIPFTIYQPGIQQAIVELTDYPVTYDDKFYLSFDVTSSIKVLTINAKQTSRYLDALFSQDSAILMKNVDEKALDYSSLSNYSLLVLNELTSISSGLAEELKRYIANGGAVAIFPSPDATLDTYNSLLASVGCPVYMAADTANTKVVSINEADPVFRNVFEKTPGEKPQNIELPVVSKYFPIASKAVSLSVSVMKMLNGRDFLTMTTSGNGKVYQFAVPLQDAFSNFQRQALFVPTLYNIALNSRPPAVLYSVIGKDDAIWLNIPYPSGEQILRLKSLADNFDVIPEMNRMGNGINIFVRGQVNNAGNYQLFNGATPVAGLSFNYNRNESDLECLSKDQLKALVNKAKMPGMSVLETTNKPVNQLLDEINHGISLWKWFVILALVCLIAEAILLRTEKK
jgi:hypothetical protein